MSAFRIATHVIECHFVFGLSRMGLKEDGQIGATVRARMIASSRQCRIRDDIGHDLRELVYFVRDLIHVYAWVVRLFLMVAVSTLFNQLYLA